MEGFLNGVDRNTTGKGVVKFGGNWRIFGACNDRLKRGFRAKRGSGGLFVIISGSERT